MSGSWGCPHEVDGLCQRVNGAICEPGMRGCVLDGRVTFPDRRPHLPRWPSPDDVGDAGDEPLGPAEAENVDAGGAAVSAAGQSQHEKGARR